MSLETYIQAMPKVELNIRLEGGVSAETMLMIAEQNEVIDSRDAGRDKLRKANPVKLLPFAREISTWVQQADDLTRLVYDLGTTLAKQNVRYAEVNINPALYDKIGLQPEEFLATINDGRDRAVRAWGIRLVWILAIPRDEPRRADDYARWSSLVNARKAGIVGLGLVGDEKAQPVGQFERAFHTAEKKGVARLPHAGDHRGGEGVLETINLLLPHRVADGWGVWESREALALLSERSITLDTSMSAALFRRQIASYADYPLRKLYDENVQITLGADMPLFYGASLSDLYRAAVEKCGLTVEELEEIALNAVRASLLPDEEKEALLTAFMAEYDQLRAEHLPAEARAD
jgi:adenosine deaminase